MSRKRLVVATIAASVLLGATASIAALPSPSPSETEAQNYIADAKRQIAAGNLRAAEIQLKNAVQANPNDPTIRILLAEVYVKLFDFPAANAELRIAQQHGGAEELIAPLLAVTLYHQAKFEELFRQVHPGDRPPAQESAVRLALGEAHLYLGELDSAEGLLRDAERLNPDNIAAKLAVARLLLARHDVSGADREVDEVLSKVQRVDALNLKAQILAEKGDAQGALARYDTILSAVKTNSAAHLGRATVLLSQNKLEEADKDVSAVLAVSPNYPQANYLKGLILAREGKFQEADNALQMVRDRLNSPPGLYLQAAVKYELKQYEQAENLLIKVIARQPSNVDARRLLARLALVKENPDQAIKVLKPVLDADPKDIQALSLTAQAYARKGKLDQALQFYQSAASLRPNDAEMQTKLALLRMNAGNVDQGLAQLEGLTHDAQDEKVVAPILVLSALQTGRVSEAASAAEALVKDDPKSVVGRNLLGMVRVAQKDYNGAEKIFIELIKENPKFLAARENLGSLYLISARLDDATKTYKQILEVSPKDANAPRQLATIALRQGKTDQAVDWLKRAQDVAKDPAPGIQLMRLYAAQKQWQFATKVGLDLQSKFSTNLAVVEALGQVQAGAGDQQASAATFQRLTQLAPKSSVAYQQYAEAQLRAKDVVGARASLKQAIVLAPTDRAPKQQLVNLEYQTGGADTALKTAQSFASDDLVGSTILSAGVLQRSGRQADAEALLAKAQQEHPDTQLVIALAGLRINKGERADAEKLLVSWLKDHSGDHAAQLALGEAHLSDENYDAALTEFEQLYKEEPNNVVVLNNLSWLYQHKKDPRARTLAEKAYALAPASPAIADTLGWILVDNGKTTEGLPYLKQAAAFLSTDMDVQYHLAVALERSGQTSDAKALLERIVGSKQTFKSREEAQKMLDQLQRG